MMLWKTAGRCAVCAAALLLASFPLLAQKEHTAPPAAKAGAAAGKSETTGKPVAAPAPPTAPAEGPAPQPQGPRKPRWANFSRCCTRRAPRSRPAWTRSSPNPPRSSTPPHGDLELVDGGAERQRVCLDRRAQLRQQGDPERRGNPVRRTARLRQMRGRHLADLPLRAILQRAAGLADKGGAYNRDAACLAGRRNEERLSRRADPDGRRRLRAGVGRDAAIAVCRGGRRGSSMHGWDAKQYLRFADERTQPAPHHLARRDLP